MSQIRMLPSNVSGDSAYRNVDRPHTRFESIYWGSKLIIDRAPISNTSWRDPRRTTAIRTGGTLVRNPGDDLDAIPAVRERNIGQVNAERIAALEAVEPDKAKEHRGELDADRNVGREDSGAPSLERDRAPEQAHAPKGLDVTWDCRRVAGAIAPFAGNNGGGPRVPWRLRGHVDVSRIRWFPSWHWLSRTRQGIIFVLLPPASVQVRGPANGEYTDGQRF